MIALSIVAFAVAAACALAWNILYPRLLRQLREGHAELYSKLGSPRHLELRPEPLVAMFAFLLRREYLAVSDTALVKLAGSARLVLLAAYFAAGIALVCSLIVWLRAP